jgi:hypothetical protein
MWEIIIPSLVVIIGFIITIRNTNAQIKSAFSQLESRFMMENKLQRELTVKEKAEETYSTIQEIMDVAHSIKREVGVFITGIRWSNKQLQSVYSRLLNPINKLRLLLYLYFPRIAKTELDSIAAAYDLVEALRAYAVQHTDITIGNKQLNGSHLAELSGQALDYDSFIERYSKNIELLNNLLDKFAKDVSKVLTSDDFA